MEVPDKRQKMKMKMICAACDLIIDPSGKLGDAWRDLTPGSAGLNELNELNGLSGLSGLTSSPEKLPPEEEEGMEKYIPKAEVWSTFCKYMLEGRNTRVKMFRSRHLHDLTFCPFCLRLIKKIHAFEKEINQLYERIDSMINCLKTKIQVSLESGLTEDNNNSKSSVREFMLGIKSSKGKSKKGGKSSNSKPVIKDVRIVLTRVEESEEGKKSPDSVLEDKEQEDVKYIAEKIQVEQAGQVGQEGQDEPEAHEILNEGSEGIPLGEADRKENIENENESNEDSSKKLRKSGRKRKTLNNSKEFLYFDEKPPPVGKKEEVEVEDIVSDVGDWTDGSLDGYEYQHHIELSPGEMDVEFGQNSSQDPDLEGDETEGDSNNSKDLESKEESKAGGDSEKRKPKRRSQRNESELKGKRSKKDTRERKTRRRRLVINQLEGDLFEWKGFKFRKLENGKMQCEHCPSLLNNQPCLILHIRKIHLREGVGVFPCPVCGKSFDRAEILKAHMFIHDEKRYQCYICGKLYHQRPNLTHHIKTHAGNFKYQCDFENCRKTFLTRGQLANHTRRHLGLKTFQCEYCSRLFVDRSELNRHLRSHAEQLPFKCNLCNSSFFIKYRLKRHYMNVHKVEPPAVIEMVDSGKIPEPPNNTNTPTQVLLINQVSPDQDHLHLEQDIQNSLEGNLEGNLEGTTTTVIVSNDTIGEDGVSINTIHVVDAVFMEETVVTTEPSSHVLHQVNPHKELITFQSMLE